MGDKTMAAKRTKADSTMNITRIGRRPLLIAGGLAVAVPSVTWLGTSARELRLSGATMGTSWTMRAADPAGAVPEAVLRQRIEARLAEINLSMSTWLPQSEISRFNAAGETGWHPISKDFHTVAQEAAQVADLSGGAFDATVGALVQLWGFGSVGLRWEHPQAREVAALRARLGHDKLHVDGNAPRLRKTEPGLGLDFSGIAKGYAVDQLATVAEAAGLQDYLVEIGGEVRVKGRNVDGKPWRIGIEKPDAQGRVVSRVLGLTRGSIATSGDYRHFYERDGQRFSHTIDPTTGHPVQHGLASVTVVADGAMTADALATALMVMGEERGRVFAEENGFASLFLVRERQGGFRTSTTGAFDALSIA